MKLRNYELNCSAIRNIVFVLICMMALCTQQANTQQLRWQHVFDTGVEDYAVGVATDSQGNIIVAGTTVPASIQPLNYNDFLIVKYNPFGDTLWTRRFDAADHDPAAGVAIDNADNIIVVGSTYTDTTYSAIRIVKYDPDGNILYTRTHTSGDKDIGEFGAGVATDSKNNIVVAGNRNSNWGDYITFKYDSSGNLLWTRTYDGDWEDCATGVAVDDSDNVVVTGYSNGDMNWDWCTMKYSPDGDTLWVRRHDVALDDKADGVTCDNDGNVIVVGRLGQSPEKYAAVVKYSPTGDTLWTKLFVRPVPLDGLMNFVDVVTDSHDNIYLAGYYIPGDSIGNNRSDYYIAKCNSQDDTLWTFLFNYDNDDEITGIAMDRSGDVVVTGSTNNRYGWYEPNYLTIKVKNNIDDVIEKKPPIPKDFIIYPNYPNPFNSSTIIEFTVPSTLHVVLKVYTLLGQELETPIDERKMQGIYNIRWDAFRYKSGVYIVRLIAGNYIAYQKLLLIK